MSVERVISGPGLASIYDFLRTHWAYESRVTAEIDEKFTGAAEHMKGAIVAAGAAAGDVVCGKVVDIFSECYGSEAGNAALKWLPYGGLYISGGIGAKNPDWVKNSHFLEAYNNKGRLSPVVAQVLCRTTAVPRWVLIHPVPRPRGVAGCSSPPLPSPPLPSERRCRSTS